MKNKIILVVSFFALAVIALLAFVFSRPKNVLNINQNFPENKTTTPLPKDLTVTTQPTQTVATGDYNVEWLIVRDPKKILLYTNLEDKIGSSEATKKYGCNQLVSGGFYSQDDKYLGLLISEGKVLSNSITSGLLNGYFYIKNDKKFAISGTPPETADTRLAVQSGPLLMRNSTPIPLNLENDENARRVTVATTKKGEVVFILFYYKTSPLLGPKLSEIPEFLDKIQNGTNLKFIDALNLDGGSHSVFISESVKVTEVSRVGTFFCIKP